MILTASAEPSRGWGGPLAILAAFVIFRVVVMPVGLWVMGKIKSPSPPPALPAGSRKKVQATVGVSRDEPRRDRHYAWGAIGYEQPGEIEPYEEPAERPGWRHRLAQARQVMTTGSHVLPEPDVEPEPPEDDIDLALDGEPEGVDDEPAEPIEKYIDRALDLGIPYNQMVKVLIDHYGVSKSTAKRRIGEVRTTRNTKG